MLLVFYAKRKGQKKTNKCKRLHAMDMLVFGLNAIIVYYFYFNDISNNKNKK